MEWRKIIIDNKETNDSVDSIGTVRNDTTGYILKHQIHSEYHKVGLAINGKTKLCSVHRLVAAAFIPNPDNLPEVNHKDECKTNNTVENLEWCTNYYNQNYGSHQANCAKAHLNHPSYSKAVDVYDLNMNFIETLPSSRECERKYNVKSSNVRECCHGGKWSDKTHTVWWERKRVGNYIFRYHK